MENQIKLQLEIDKETAQGIYSNFQAILFSEAEFIVDFARTMPHTPVAKIHSRLVLTPRCAKALMMNLKQNIENYETAHGEIPMPNMPANNIGFKITEEKTS